jgi:hypothetical protein
MAVRKKVLAYAPVWTPITYDKDQNEVFGQSKALFWIKWPKEPTTTKVLTKRIMPTVNFVSAGRWSKAIHFDSIAIEKFKNRLLDKVAKDSIIAYTFGESDIPDVFTKGKDMYNLMNKIDTIRRTRAVPPYDMYDTVIISNPNISAIRYLEEWSFDPITMAITKKVVGLCPVELCYDENGEFKGFRPYFWTYFADVWMPLEGKLELKKK